ncbi:pectate lyase [Clostridium gelidum]|uniref:Pectate lyase n=1 Tax=Clostridium gelidum TaxID=704125 RepID=A0ABN6J5F1_9CLOT|nr:right-handed parallel beta-helix repeat-containing protein [Clostridium gelidum]BCZ47864.1 pectate lyase [Clostridium gelidum]
MKNIKKLCLMAALGVMVTGGSLLPSTTAYAATTIPVTVGGSLEAAIANAKPGDTITISGTVTAGSITVPSGVTITGKTGKGKIDFSKTGKVNGKRGFVVNGTGSTIADLEIYNAGDNGIYVEGTKNFFTNLNVHNNNDAGVQLSNGASYNTLTGVNSHDNCDQYKTDKTKLGENADGFAIKLHSGVGNILTDCTAQGNSDDGYDLYAAHGAVKFTNCKAIKNGICNGIKGDGNGFKVGGIDNKTPGQPAHADALNHVLIGCTASGNTGAGFDRNNQTGVVTMTRCNSDNNLLGNYQFPATGTPSALGKTITFGTAIIDGCTSTGAGANKNNLSGAKVTNSPTVK